MKPVTFLAATCATVLVTTASVSAYLGAKHQRELREHQIVLCYEHAECYR